MPCSPCSHNTRPVRVMSAGPLCRVGVAGPPRTPYGPPPPMSYCYCFALNAGGHVWIPRPRHGAAPWRILTPAPQTCRTIPTSPWNAVLKSTCGLSDPVQTNPFPRAQGEPISVYLFIRLCPPGRLSRTPRRHAQGAILPDDAQMPRRSAFASFSALANRISRGLYRRYHHAQPAPTMARLQSTPAPLTTRTTSRPHASPSSNVTSNGPTDSNAFRKRRAPRNPICPFSGASSPYRRPRIVTPYGFTKSTVSPS